MIFAKDVVLLEIEVRAECLLTFPNCWSNVYLALDPKENWCFRELVLVDGNNTSNEYV